MRYDLGSKKLLYLFTEVNCVLLNAGQVIHGREPIIYK